MNKIPLFPLSHRALAALLIIALSIIFVAVFFLSPPPANYKYVVTHTGEVVEIWVPTPNRYRQKNPIAIVRFKDGTTGKVSLSTQPIILKGQFIEVDVLEADGKKPRYRLAQLSATP